MSRFIIAGILLLVVVGGWRLTAVQGQTAEPINISLSGAAGDPFLVVDRSGVAHIIWTDDFSGLMYARAAGDSWSEPQAVDLPFAEARPLLLGDAAANIHAFWLDEENELLYSRAAADNVANAASWTTPQLLAESALTMWATVELNGRIHLTYIRSQQSEERPAGVYYRRSTLNQNEWGAPQLLYQSAYFRAMRQDRAHVHLAVADNGALFAAWDNRALDTVFVARSTNNGQSWRPAEVVDRREESDGPTAVGPSKIQAVAFNDNVHLLWQAGHDGLNCALYQQSSSDNGASWTARQQLRNTPGCPVQSWFFAPNNAFLLLAAQFPDRLLGKAQQDGVWSDSQTIVSSAALTNPQTFRPIQLGCQQAALRQPNELLLVGCDTGIAPDIWAITHSIGDQDDWFAPPSTWENPIVAAAQEQPVAQAAAVSGNGYLHLFWRGEASLGGRYARYDGSRWTPPITPFGLNHDNITAPSAIITPGNRLLVAWSDKQTGQIFLSQVSAETGWQAGEWLPPEQLPTTGMAASPHMLLTPEGVIYIAYAVLMNEGRGVYLTRSDNMGASWSSPQLVFDGAAAGWTAVDWPELGWTAGHLHLSWARFALPGVGAPLEIVYARSADGGDSWSDPILATEAAVSWNRIVGVGERTVHHLWQTLDEVYPVVWHRFSTDHGANWSRATMVGGLDAIERPVAITADSLGRLHFLQAAETTIVHWLWDGSQWLGQEPLTLANLSAGQITTLATAMREENWLAAIYSRATEGEDSEQFFLTGRSLELPQETPTPLPTLTPTPPAPPTPTPTATPSPTPPPLTLDEEAPRPPINTLTALIIGVIPAALVIIIFLGVGLRNYWRPFLQR